MLIQSLSTTLLNRIQINNLSINISDDEIKYLKNIINTDPTIISNIQNDINSIIEDNKIDYKDIPKIVLLISDIFSDHLIENKISPAGIINIIKFILDTLIDYNLLPIPNIEKIIAKQLIDSSLSLLSKNIYILDNINCVSSFKIGFKKVILFILNIFKQR